MIISIISISVLVSLMSDDFMTLTTEIQQPKAEIFCQVCGE